MRLVFLAGAWLVTALAAYAQPCHDERPEAADALPAPTAAASPARALVDGCCGIWQAECLCCEVHPAPLAPAREQAKAPANAVQSAAWAVARPVPLGPSTGGPPERGPPPGGVDEQGPRGPPADARA